jgi:hypothetical protein
MRSTDRSLRTELSMTRLELPPRVHLVNLIRKNPKPTLSDDMVLLVGAGQEVPLEPIIFNNLTATGIWDQRPFLKLIQDHAFGLIIYWRSAEVRSSQAR